MADFSGCENCIFIGTEGVLATPSRVGGCGCPTQHGQSCSPAKLVWCGFIRSGTGAARGGGIGAAPNGPDLFHGRFK
jgi:hypothetical protein